MIIYQRANAINTNNINGLRPHNQSKSPPSHQQAVEQAHAGPSCRFISNVAPASSPSPSAYIWWGADMALQRYLVEFDFRFNNR